MHYALRKSSLAVEDGAGGAEDGDNVSVLRCDVPPDYGSRYRGSGSAKVMRRRG